MTMPVETMPLPLWPDEEDVPLDLTGALANETAGATALAGEVMDLEQERDALRRALVDALAHVEAGTAPHGSRVRAWRELAGTAYVDGLTPAERRDDGIARASARWTDEEVAQVDAAIRAVAARRLDAYLTAVDADQDPDTDEDYLDLLEFTTAHVWAELGTAVPVTKGIAGRMFAARSAGIIASTGRTTVLDSAHTAGPNHGQRLTVWRAR